MVLLFQCYNPKHVGGIIIKTKFPPFRVSSKSTYRSRSATASPFAPRRYAPASSHLSSLFFSQKSIQNWLSYIQIRVTTSCFYLLETGRAEPQLECVQECVWFTVQSWPSMPMDCTNGRWKEQCCCCCHCQCCQV